MGNITNMIDDNLLLLHSYQITQNRQFQTPQTLCPIMAET